MTYLIDLETRSLLLDFAVEAKENLQIATDALTSLSENPDDMHLTHDVFRPIHSIKGAASMFQLMQLTRLGHALETLLGKYREGHTRISDDSLTLMLTSIDMLFELVSSLEQRLALLEDELEVEDSGVTQLIEQLTEAYQQLSTTATVVAPKQEDVKPVVIHETEDVPLSRGDSHDLSPHLFSEFRAEAQECLEGTEVALDLLITQAIEGDAAHDAVNLVFRAVHTIKGSSSYLRIEPIVYLSHAAESLLDLLRSCDLKEVPRAVFELSLLSIDRLREKVGLVGMDGSRVVTTQSDEELVRDLNDVVQELSPLKQAKTASSQPASFCPLTVFLDAAFQHLSYIEKGITEVVSSQGATIASSTLRALSTLENSAQYMGLDDIGESAARLGDLLEAETISVPQVVASWERLKGAVQEKQERPASPPVEVAPVIEEPVVQEPIQVKERHEEASSKLGEGGEKTMRIDQSLLDVFMNLVGELIVSKNGLAHLSKLLEGGEEERKRGLRELRDLTGQVVRISEEMQQRVMEMRMVPVKTVFQKIPRVIREVGRKLGKNVDIVLEGEGTEIDKAVAEAIADPLIHLARNAADHGLELPNDRVALGKSDKGRVTLRAKNENSLVVIEICDDGRGLDPQKLVAKALEKGIISSDHASRITEEQALELIFAPGFSTAEAITDISGRGVGMDVVKTNIKKLNGNVSIRSKIGEGTVVRLELPSTMAILDALLIQNQRQLYAVPLQYVVETLKIEPRELQTILGHKALPLRGEIIGVQSLCELLGIPQPEIEENEKISLLVCRAGSTKVGIVVDRVIRQEEIVSKPLPEMLSSCSKFSGASVLGDGSAILILDPPHLLESSTERNSSSMSVH